MRYINALEFVNWMDDFFEEYILMDKPIETLEHFWKEHRNQVIETYKDSDKWISFYNVITGIIDEYE